MALKPSPYLEAQLEALRQKYGEARFITSEPGISVPPPVEEEEPGLATRAARTIGGYLGAPKRYLVDLPINYMATEPLRERAKRYWETGDERFAPVPAGELAKDAYVGLPEPGDSPAVAHAKGVSRGLIGRYIDVTTDPVNVGLMAGGAVLAGAAPAAAKAMHLGFTGLMAKGVYDAGDAAYQTYRKEGWTPAVSEKATEAVVDAGFLLGPLAMRGRAPRPPTEVGGLPTLYEPDFGRVRRAPVETRPYARTRALLGPGEGEIVEGEVIPPAGLPPMAPPLAPPPGMLAEPPAGPPPPEPSAVQPKTKTPYETPAVGRMSQAAVTAALEGLDGQIRMAEATGLGSEVARLAKVRQALAESYTVQEAPPPPPARDPYAPPTAEALGEPDAVRMVLRLQQEASDARLGGDAQTAVERDATAASLRAQIKARREAAVPAPPPQPAPDMTIPGAAPPEAPGRLPGVPAGVEVRTTPAEPLIPQEPTERVPELVAEARPRVQALLEQARGGGEGAGPLADVIAGRKPSHVPITVSPDVTPAPATGGVPVPVPPPAPALPVTPTAGPPPTGGPVIEMKPAAAPRVNPQVAPLALFLGTLTDPRKVGEFFDMAGSLLPQDRPWTPDDLDWAASRLPLDPALVAATKALLQSGIPGAAEAESPAPVEEAITRPLEPVRRPPPPPAPPAAPAPPAEEAAARAEVASALAQIGPAEAAPAAPPPAVPAPEAVQRPARVEVAPAILLKPGDVADVGPFGWSQVIANDRVAGRQRLTLATPEGEKKATFSGDHLFDVGAEERPAAPAPAPRVEQTPLAPEPEEFIPPLEEEMPAQEVLSDREVQELADMLEDARRTQEAEGDEPGFPEMPGADDVEQVLGDMGVAVSREEAARIADRIAGETGAGLTTPAVEPTIQPEEVTRAAPAEAQAGPGERPAEGPPGVPLPAELPGPREEAGGEGRPGLVPEAEGRAPRGHPVPADRLGEAGVLPGRGARGRRGVRPAEAGERGEPRGAEPGVAVEAPAPPPEEAEPQLQAAPAPPPEGALFNPVVVPDFTPAEPITADTPKDFSLFDEAGDALGEGRTWGQKLEDNLSAVRLLKDIEATGRRPTFEEQRTLSRYVGWGGIPQVFKPWTVNWNERGKAEASQTELKALLTEAEWESAQLSTPNAHYTSEAIVRGMWDFLDALGLTSGQRMLEPSLGIGNFFMLGPPGVRKTGVELDSLTGRIARLLTPSANIQITGLEQAALPTNFFDFSAGNPPFGHIKVFDPVYRGDSRVTESIHNYMFVKALDAVRPGGLVAFITSRYTLDSKDQSIRNRLLDRADLVAAVRLPNTAFEKNANTQVVTDVLVFRKRPAGVARPDSAPWLATVPAQFEAEQNEEGGEVQRNAVWDGFGQILGKETKSGQMYRGGEYTVEGTAPTRDRISSALLKSLARAGFDPIKNPEHQFLRQLTIEAPRAVRQRIMLTADQVRAVKPGNIVDQNGKLFERVGAELEEWEPPESKNPALAASDVDRKGREKALAALQAKIREFIGLRDTTKELLASQIDSALTDEQFASTRRKAEKLYDAFVKKHGFIHDNVKDLRADTDFPNVLALEKEYTPATYRKEGKKRTVVAPATAVKSDIFKKRLAGKPVVATSAESTREAYLITLGERGALDWDRMSELVGKSVDEVQSEAKAQGFVFFDPETRSLTMGEEYLSGNVRRKLKLAEAAVKDDPTLQGNVDALRGVVPQAKRPDQIEANLGVGWIAAQFLKDFLGYLSDAPEGRMRYVEPYYVESIAAWEVKNLDTILGHGSTAGTATWGADYYTAADAVEDILGLKVPKVFDTDSDGNQFLDVQKTENAKEIKGKLEQEWKRWLWTDPERTKALVDIFNDTFYGTVPRTYDGSHLTFPGMNTSILKSGTLYPFQKDAVWMMLQHPNTLVALPVGAGKTYAAIAAIMEARRMGTARKPVVVAPRAVLPQWIRAFKALYPAAQILYVDPEDMSPRSRGRVMSRIATGEYDAVLVTHEGLKKLPMDPANVERLVGAELKILDQAFQDLLRDSYDDFASALDPLIQGYLEEMIAFNEKQVDWKRDARFRRDANAQFVPHNAASLDNAKLAEQPALTVKQAVKFYRPKPPNPGADAAIKTALKGSGREVARLIKDLARRKLNLKAQVAELVDESRKDRNITFEQLGVDLMVVDEAHAFKNLFVTTAMERVPGMPSAFSARAFDLYMKSRVIQERNGGRGLHFLTGTPVTNTIAEIYTLFRYLDPTGLDEKGMAHFDAWARNFATTAVGIEVDPTGSRMRTQLRFNRFVNLGALLRAFRSFTYYKQAEDLGIERPSLAKNESGERKPRTMVVQRSEPLTAFVKSLIVRADRLKSKGRDVTDDNPLLITTDGMKGALDMRLVNPEYADDPNSKLNQATRKIFEIWQRTKFDRRTQLVFMDMGTPGKGTMRVTERWASGEMRQKFDAPKLNLYEDMRRKLVAMGVPREEVEFIYDWQDNEEKAADLYSAVNEGHVRILLASSDKGGVGVNVQKKMVALHHMDVPYTPDKLEQREGRIVRQGNENAEVEIYNWVTKGTFDVYKWQLIMQKATFIGQVLSGNLEADSMEDLSYTALTAEEVIALGSDNPLVRERMVAEKKLERLERLQHGWYNKRRQVAVDMATREQQLNAQTELHGYYQRNLAVRTEALSFTPEVSKRYQQLVDGLARSEAVLARNEAHKAEIAKSAAVLKEQEASLRGETPLTDKDQIGAVLWSLLAAYREGLVLTENEKIGTYRGLPVTVRVFNGPSGVVSAGRVGYGRNDFDRVQFSAMDPKNAFASIEAVLGRKALEERVAKSDGEMARYRRDVERLKDQTEGRFPQEGEMAEIQKQLYDIEEALGLHKKDTEGSGAVAAQETEQGAGGAGEPPEEPPDLPEETPYPDDEGANSQEPKDPPEGRPDQGPQPGETGWDRRVKNARARTRARGRGGVANLGVDPMGFWDAVVLGVNALLRGARTFASWVASVVSGMGANPGGNMLRRIWRASREWFQARQGPARRRYRPVSDVPPLEPEDVFRRQGYREPRVHEEEVRGAAAAAAGAGPTPAWDRPGGTPDFDVNLHTVRDEGGLRDLQARLISNLERSLGRKARQVRTWAEVRAEAVLSGITEADFRRMLRKGIVTDMSITAGRILRQEAAKNVQSKLGAWREVLEQARGEVTQARRELLEQEALDAQREYTAAVAQYAGIAADTVAAGSEAGRALAAHRMLLESLSPEERFVKRVLRGLQPDERLIAQLTDALMRKDHVAIAQISRQILKPGPVRMAVEYFVNSILSGLASPAANVLGNTMFVGMLTGERGLAAGLEAGFRPWLERVLAGTETPRERIGGEAWEMGRSLLKAKFGLWRGMLEAYRAVKSEDMYNAIKGEYTVPAIPGVLGKIIRTPGRLMDALDIGAKVAAKDAEKAAQVLRAAVTEGKRHGWNAERVEGRIREIETDLNRYIEIESARKAGIAVDQGDMDFLVRHRGSLGEMLRSMDKFANEATFRDDTTKLTKYLMSARNTYPWLSFVVPFIKTPERILVQGFRRTPAGLARTLYQMHTGELRGGAAADRLAAGMLGSLVSGAIYMAVVDGHLTGGGPADPDERRNWEKTGKKPYAVKIGNRWISLARIEPLATTLGFAADLAEARNEKTAGDAWDKLHYSFINNVANKTYLTGAISVAEALGDPERYGARMEKQLVGSLVPNLLASAARAIDPVLRDTRDLTGTLMSRVPIASQMLPAKLTGTGEPQLRGEDPVSRFLSPFRYAKEAGPEANLERLFLETGYNPAAPPRDMTIGGRKVLLTAEERKLYGSYAERATAFARQLAAKADWSSLEVLQKEEFLRRIYRMAHDSARRELFSRVLARVRSGGFKLKEA